MYANRKQWSVSIFVCFIGRRVECKHGTMTRASETDCRDGEFKSGPQEVLG